MRPDPITEVARSDLTPGRLAEVFRGGAGAVVLTDDERVSQLWHDLVERSGGGSETAESLPWEDALFDVVRNHRSNPADLEGQLGDLVRCVPGGLGYVARKIDVTKSPGGDAMTSVPAAFQRRDQTYGIPPETLATLWELATDIWVSLVPPDRAAPYCVAFERLKYSDDLKSFEELAEFLQYSGGTWAKLGHQLDGHAELMRRLTNNRPLRHVLAMLCMFPSLARPLHRRAAAKASRSAEFGNTNGGTIIGHPHTDGRYANCMCSARDAIRTEIMAEDRWLPIPMSTDRLAILPGADLGRVVGINPTVHRVIHTEPLASQRKPSWSNVTMIVGLKDPARSMPAAA